MKTVIFTDAHGNVSSKRTWLNGNQYSTVYPGQPGRGGNTFTNKHTYSRFDNNGRLMSWGINNGRGITHFDSNNRLRNGIADF